jgi:hypothetical protein
VTEAVAKYVRRGDIKIEKRYPRGKKTNAHFATEEFAASYERQRPLRPPKMWSLAAVAELIQRYPHENTAQLAKELGTTVDGVQRKAMKVGACKTQEFLYQQRLDISQRWADNPPDLRAAILLNNQLKRKLDGKH